MPNDLPLFKDTYTFDHLYDKDHAMFRIETQSKYIYIPKNVRNRDIGFDQPIHDVTKSPDLDDMICHGTGEVTICEGDGGEMSWEWDDYIIVRSGENIRR